MGKWTAGYHDDVLASKMKGLVAGALKRSRIEKIEPMISYEAFVEDLDSGDSFTTSLIEVLVKEVAGRRTRQNLADRRLITDRTAQSLHLLATPMRVYRDRTFSRVPIGRRGVNPTDYLTSPPVEMEMEEDETDYEGMVEADNVSSYLEGARVSSELYDAYGTHSWSHPTSSSLLRRSHPNYSALIAHSDSPDNSTIDSVPPPIETRRSSWGLPSSTLLSNSSATLTRQPSIRRSIRSRAADFNNFSTRRRSSYRSTADSEDPRSPDEFPDWGSSGPASDEPLGSNAARRFFPFSRRRHDMPPSGMLWPDIGGSPSRPVSPPDPISYRSLRSGSSSGPVLISARVFAEHEASLGEEPDRLLPRLRRGGLRAPESMLSRHASPAMGEADDTTSSIVISIQRETQGDAAPTEVAVSAEEQSRTQVDADL